MTVEALRSNDSSQWKPGGPFQENGISPMWFEKNPNIILSEWTSATTGPHRGSTSSTGDPLRNMTLNPQEVAQLMDYLQLLNATVLEYSQKFYHKEKPMLHDLMFQWLYHLVNQTKIDESTAFTSPESTTSREMPLIPDGPLRGNREFNEDYKGFSDESFAALGFGDVSSMKRLPNLPMISHHYPPGINDGPLEAHGHPTKSQNFEGVSPRFQGYSSGFNEYSNPLGLDLYHHPTAYGDITPEKYQPDPHSYPGPYKYSGNKVVPPDLQGPPPASEQVSQGNQTGTERHPGFEGGPPGFQEHPPASKDVPESERFPSGQEEPGSPGYPSSESLPKGSERLQPSPGQQQVSQSYSDPENAPWMPQGYQGLPPERTFVSEMKLNQEAKELKPRFEENIFQPGNQFMQDLPYLPQMSPATFPALEVTTQTDAPLQAEKQPAAYGDIILEPQYEDLPAFMDPTQFSSSYTTSTQLSVSTTTTSSVPLVAEMQAQMVKDNIGFFTVFLTKITELLVTKKLKDTYELTYATNHVIETMDIEGSLIILGAPLGPAIVTGVSLLAEMPSTTLQGQAANIHKQLEEKNEMLSQEALELLQGLDQLYTNEEGDALLHSLADADYFPANNPNGTAVMETMIKAILAPFYRLQGKEELTRLLSLINHAITERFSHRRKDNLGFNTDQKIMNHNSNFKTERASGNERKQDGRTHSRARDRKNNFAKGIRLRNAKSMTNIENIGEFRKKITRDSDFKFDKPKIKNHLNFKYHELNEKYRMKHDQAIALAEKQKDFLADRLRGHNYEKLLRNINLNEDLESIAVWSKLTKTPQKRFNIITVTEKSIEKSKYLSKLMPKNKATAISIAKNIKTNKRSLFTESSSSSDEEKKLKFNLQDTIRHGDRQFFARRNYANNDNVGLSSYSDEEGIIKSNIYKVFGCTPRLI